MKKRTFTAEFKSKLVLEVLRGEKELSVIATDNEIAPNQLRNWKNEFIEKASNVFDNKKDDALKTELALEKAEKERLYSKVGQLTIQVDWLKKKSEEIFGSGWENKFAQESKK